MGKWWCKKKCHRDTSTCHNKCGKSCNKHCACNKPAETCLGITKSKSYCLNKCHNKLQSYCKKNCDKQCSSSCSCNACVDSRTWLVKVKRKLKNCSWLGQQKEEKKAKYCNKKGETED